MTWTVEEARSVACPKCGAAVGERCVYTGKGALKANARGRHHQERIDVMVTLRRQSKPRWRRDLSDVLE